jgi:serine/threonine-protein kinase
MGLEMTSFCENCGLEYGAEAGTPHVCSLPASETASPSEFDARGTATADRSAMGSGATAADAPAAKTVGGAVTSSALAPLTAGTLVGSRYEVVRKVGGGGMGAVYLAKDKNLGGVERALKEMIQTSLDEEQQAKAIDDFKRESTLLSTLEHPAIPTIYDFFFDDELKRFYLVMKYISGGDLASRLNATREGRLDERTVTDWAIQICDVLSYLHRHPEAIIYRDIKPSNIMIDGRTGRVVLVDFGIARSVSGGYEKGVTAVGTMGYAPPELFSGKAEPRSDIYSLGSTMFHLLTGADPQSNPLLIFDFEKNPRPRQINPQISDQMERIIMRAVEYSVENRFASAEEMKDHLISHLERLNSNSATYGVDQIQPSAGLSNQSVFCGFCGRQIIATDHFCAFCGSRQPISRRMEAFGPGVKTEATAKLIVDCTSELNVPVYLLEKPEMLLGRRDPTANIFPEVDLSRFDPQTKISRRHARIYREGNNFILEDLGSSNGTLVFESSGNGVKLLPHTPHVLSSGDRIRMGDTTLQFLIN